MNKIAVFPGSFDPITLGHVDLVKRAIPLFDKIYIAIGVNTQKKYLFSVADRLSWIKSVFANEPKIVVDSFSGLTINYCQEIGASYLLRGIRSAADFEYEKTIAHLNYAMQPEIESILMLARPEMAPVSSTIVREIILGGGEIKKFVPAEIVEQLRRQVRPE